MSSLLAYCLPSPNLIDVEDEMNFHLRQTNSLQNPPPSPSSASRNRPGSQSVPNRRPYAPSHQGGGRFLHTPTNRSPSHAPSPAQSFANASSLIPQTENESETDTQRGDLNSAKQFKRSPEARYQTFVAKNETAANYAQYELDLESTPASPPMTRQASSPMRSRVRSPKAIDVVSPAHRSPQRLRYLPPISRRSDTSRDVEVWDAAGASPHLRRTAAKSPLVRLNGSRSMSPAHQSQQTSVTADCISENMLSILQRIEQHLSVPTPLELWASRQFQKEEAGERRHFLTQQLMHCVDKADAQERILDATRQWPDDTQLIIEVLLDCVTAPEAANRPRWLAIQT